MKRWITVLFILTLIFGCAAKPKPAPIIEKNPRIIERDLTQLRLKIESPVAASPPVERPAVQPVTVVAEPEPLKFQIEFVNDSSSRLLGQGKQALQEIKQQVHDADSVMLIGYSNGMTAVGNSLLASRRADFVAAKLVNFGVSRDKIKTLASWSPQITKESPAKGVQVFLRVSPVILKTESGGAAT